MAAGQPATDCEPAGDGNPTGVGWVNRGPRGGAGDFFADTNAFLKETDAGSSLPAGTERPSNVLVYFINYAMSYELYIVRPRLDTEALGKMIGII
eukprot:13226786-Heterocapsa_arctica.AAC.1